MLRVSQYNLSVTTKCCHLQFPPDFSRIYALAIQEESRPDINGTRTLSYSTKFSFGDYWALWIEGAVFWDEGIFVCLLLNEFLVAVFLHTSSRTANFYWKPSKRLLGSFIHLLSNGVILSLWGILSTAMRTVKPVHIPRGGTASA